MAENKEQPAVTLVSANAELKALLVKVADAGKTGKIDDLLQLANDVNKVKAVITKLEQDTRFIRLNSVITVVKEAVMPVLQKLVDTKKLDEADGIWITWDFGAKVETGINPSIKVVRSMPKATKTSSGKAKAGVSKSGKSTTEELLPKYGATQYKDTGMTVQAYFDANPDKNKRFALLEWMRKQNGES